LLQLVSRHDFKTVAENGFRPERKLRFFARWNQFVAMMFARNAMSNVEAEARFDGKWVLKTNTGLSAETVAPKGKERWQVEHTFRDLKSTFETRPVFHQTDETIQRHGGSKGHAAGAPTEFSSGRPPEAGNSIGIKSQTAPSKMSIYPGSQAEPAPFQATWISPAQGRT
jgi:hypothetical protein